MPLSPLSRRRLMATTAAAFAAAGLPLKALAARPGRVVERDRLAADVFPDEQAPSPNALDVHVGRLRRKLAPDGPRLSTLRGVGYRIDP